MENIVENPSLMNASDDNAQATEPNKHKMPESSQQLYERVKQEADEMVKNPESLNALVDQYRKEFGNKIDTDSARELFGEYRNGNKETRTLLTQAVHEASSKVANEVWNRAIKEPVSDIKNNYVVILAGGSGSGKGTATENYIPHDHAPHAIYDTTLSKYDAAKKRIDQALESGKDVSLMYVHRPVELAQKGVAERQKRTGREVPDEIIAQSHFGAQQSLMQLAKDFEGDKRVSIAVINNRGTKEQIEMSKLDKEHSIEQALDPRYLSKEDVLARIQKARLQPEVQHSISAPSKSKIVDDLQGPTTHSRGERNEIQEIQTLQSRALLGQSRDLGQQLPSDEHRSVTATELKSELTQLKQSGELQPKEVKTVDALVKKLDKVQPDTEIRTGHDIKKELGKPGRLNDEIKKSINEQAVHGESRSRSRDLCKPCTII